MTVHAFFEIVPVVLRWTAILSVLTVIALNVMRTRSRIGVTVGVCWMLLGLVFVVLLPLRWSTEVQVFDYVLFTWIAVLSVRQLAGRGPTREQAQESNRRLATALLGKRLADRAFAPVDRTLSREQEARDRGVTLLDVMKDEHARRRS